MFDQRSWARIEAERCPSLLVCFLCFLCASSSQPGAAELQWEQAQGFRSASLSLPATGHTGFARVPGSLSGILFTNVLAKESGARSQLRLAGSGVAAGDVDGDGWCDLYFCGMESGNRLYRNLGGWRFEDITDLAGVRCAGQFSTGAVFADVDGDGDRSEERRVGKECRSRWSPYH